MHVLSCQGSSYFAALFVTFEEPVLEVVLDKWFPLVIARNHHSQLASCEGALSRCALNLSWANVGHHGLLLTTDYDSRSLDTPDNALYWPGVNGVLNLMVPHMQHTATTDYATCYTSGTPDRELRLTMIVDSTCAGHPDRVPPPTARLPLCRVVPASRPAWTTAGGKRSHARNRGSV